MQFFFKEIKIKVLTSVLFGTLIFGNHVFAYQIIKNVIFDWQTPKSAKSGEFQTFFLKASYESEFGLIPIYQNKLGKCGTEIINSKIVDIILEDEKIANKDLKNISNLSLELNTTIGFEKRQAYLFVKMIPYVKVGNVLKRVISCTIQIETNNLFELPKYLGKTSYAANSVLANGQWYKIATINNAVHRIDYTFLKNLGINIDAIDPRNIKLYGNGAGMLPERNADFRYDDLQENAIIIQGESDGKFNANDYILFYGQSQKEVWKYNGSNQVFNNQPNLYSDTTYYYITISNNIGKRISSIPSATNVNYNTSTYDALVHHEEDITNFVKTGRNWYGEDFNRQPQRTFTNIISDIDTSANVIFQSNIAGRASQTNGFDVTINNLFYLNHTCSGLSLAYDGIYADINYKTLTFKPNSNRFDINYSYTGPVAQGANGWLDFYTINARAFLKNAGKQILLSDKNAVANGNIAQYNFSTTRNLSIWDVSNPTQIFTIQGIFDVTTSQFNFAADADSLRWFMAFDNSNFIKPISIGKVANQNIHALSAVQGIIISHADFLSEAKRLADYHKQKNGLNIHVINVTDIYNEFSSGSQDVSAIRDMLRMFYQKYTSPNDQLKYVTLMGRASYDYKGNFSKTKTGFVNTNYIPTYEEVNSNDPGSFCTDDFFVCLDDNEGNFAINRNAGDLMDLGIGRLPIVNIEQAKGIVDKVIYYETKSSYGDWRNKFTFIADDEWTEYQIDFMKTAEYLNNTYLSKFQKFNIQKIYANSYEPLSTAGGKRFPQVNTAITNSMNKGSLVINYIGHGGEVGWSARRILNVDEINAWNVKENMPLLMTATCEFSRFDDPSRLAAGELAMINPNGGPIALFTTVRLVYSSSNDALNDKFNSQLGLDSGAILHPKTFGELILQTKNLYATGNTRNFTLLGDPMLQLALPKYNVKTTSINNKSIGVFNDTIKALSKVTIKGSVLDENNNLMSNFNGIVYPTVFDKESEYPIIDLEKPVSISSFKLQNNIIYKGSATVTNGVFTFSFIVPKDIDYKYGYGKISYYANNDTTDASGYEGKALIGGTSDSIWVDNKGPEIQLYMNDEKFVNGGLVPENSLLIAKIYDENGINTTSRGVGRDLNAVMNKENTNTIIMNDFYRSNLNTFQSGIVNYNYKNLPLGLNKIKFQAYDIFNNVGEAEIDFIVANDSKMALQNVLNYPNPFTTKTSFHFDHNKAGQDVQVLIQIFTVNGKLVKSLQKDLVAATSHFSDLEWDGRDDYGDAIGKGVYIYKVKIKSQGKTEEAFQKLVVLN